MCKQTSSGAFENVIYFYNVSFRAKSSPTLNNVCRIEYCIKTAYYPTKQCYWTSVRMIFVDYSWSRDPQEHNPFQLSCLLPGDLSSTTRVDIGTFF